MSSNLIVVTNNYNMRMINFNKNKNYIINFRNNIFKFNLFQVFCVLFLFLVFAISSAYDFNNHFHELNKTMKLNLIYLLKHINWKCFCIPFYLMIIKFIFYSNVAEITKMFFFLFINYVMLFFNFFLIKAHILLKLFFEICFFILSFFFRSIFVFLKYPFFVLKLWFIKKRKQFCKIFNFQVLCVLTIYLDYLTWLISFLVYYVLLFHFVCSGEIILISPVMSNSYDLYPFLFKNSDPTLSGELVSINEERLEHIAFFMLLTAFIVFINGRFFY